MFAARSFEVLLERFATCLRRWKWDVLCAGSVGGTSRAARGRGQDIRSAASVFRMVLLARSRKCCLAAQVAVGGHFRMS